MIQPADEARNADRHLAILNRVARIAVEDMALRPMLQRIVETLAEEFDWEFVACAGIDASNNEFVCEAVSSRVRTEVGVGYRRALGSGIVGECALGRRTIDLDDIRGHPNFVDTMHGTRSELCVPVVHHGNVLAVLNVESRRLGAFRGQRALLETVADQIAGAIHAARLLEELGAANRHLQAAYDALETASLRDSLTGVGNRRCFDQWLAEAVVEASCSHRPLALLLIDVDHFKEYNDGYGHMAGDDCLKRIASLLAYVLEGSPARLARYGGEEFVVLLPGTDLAAASAKAGRLRLAVQARAFEHRHVGAGVITISVGVAACVPGDAGEGKALLLSADAALYQAKRSGRNRVCVAPVAGFAINREEGNGTRRA